MFQGCVPVVLIFDLDEQTRVSQGGYVTLSTFCHITVVFFKF